VTYIDSAGIGMMIAKYLSVRRKGGNLKVLHLTSRGLLVMTITRLLSVFETFDSEEQAIASFQ
jgi:anti-sigma B factor antagonist